MRCNPVGVFVCHGSLPASAVKYGGTDVPAVCATDSYVASSTCHVFPKQSTCHMPDPGAQQIMWSCPLPTGNTKWTNDASPHRLSEAEYSLPNLDKRIAVTDKYESIAISMTPKLRRHCRIMTILIIYRKHLRTSSRWPTAKLRTSTECIAPAN